MTKKSLLFTFALCGMLLLGTHRMFAPDISPMTKMSTSGGQDPLEAARDKRDRAAVLAGRRSLIAVLSTDAEGKHPTVDFTQNNKQIFLVWQDKTGSKGDRIM